MCMGRLSVRPSRRKVQKRRWLYRSTALTSAEGDEARRGASNAPSCKHLAACQQQSGKWAFRVDGLQSGSQQAAKQFMRERAELVLWASRHRTPKDKAASLR
ncbi:hypothetical protein NDU88_005156 [Pleurodeles waltl]|uniref:Uncharacterized protein n=1 Tax=Pleurodeles waltl TaxID=8319 RepID=A0AAV7T9L8_PLEWA|nr:hypothetical protein NDU88_005156 [Pleurodeles waltl]